MKKGIIISIISVVVLTAIACVVMFGSGMFTTYEKRIELAYKYLEEGKYEEAILEFDKAIKINDKKADAYIGKAETYIERGGENDVENASKALITAYEKDKGNKGKVVDAAIKISDKLIDKGDYENAYKFINPLVIVIPDDKLDDGLINIVIGYGEWKDSPDGDYFMRIFRDTFIITKRPDLPDWWDEFKKNNPDKFDDDVIAEIDNIIDDYKKGNDAVDVDDSDESSNKDSDNKEDEEKTKEEETDKTPKSVHVEDEEYDIPKEEPEKANEQEEEDEQPDKKEATRKEDENFKFYTSTYNGVDRFCAQLKDTASGIVIAPEEFGGKKVEVVMCEDNDAITALVMPDDVYRVEPILRHCPNLEILYISKNAQVPLGADVTLFPDVKHIYYDGSLEELVEKVYSSAFYYLPQDGQYHKSRTTKHIEFHFNHSREDVIKMLEGK